MTKNLLKINLSSNPFVGTGKYISIELPKGWQVNILHMEGGLLPSIHKASTIKEVIKSPLGPRLSEICKGKKSAVILFDDITRGTRVYEAVPYILDELKAGGIKDIRFIAALGAHSPHTLKHHTMKLGKDVVETYLTYNHNPFSLCEHIGNTRNGVRLRLNKEFLSCDVKIGIGAIVPHSFMGFGGGGKIVLPGVSHIDTIEENHRMLLSENIPKETWGLGVVSKNPFLEDVEDAVRLSGLDFKVDFIVGYGGRTIDVVAGSPSEVFRAGVRKASKHYRTLAKGKADIVIANSAFKVSEAVISFDQATSLVNDGGDVVLITDTTEGQVIHYLFGPFGTKYGGNMWMKKKSLPDSIGRLIVQSPLKDISSECYFGPGVLWTHTWDETVELIMERWKDKSPKVFVLPDATIQLIERVKTDA